MLAAVRLTDVPVGHSVVHAGEPAEYWVGLVNGLVAQQVSSESGRLATLTCVGPAPPSMREDRDEEIAPTC